MSTKFFVKFVSYKSGETETYLRNKTIKFSKAYELNDYFELGYIHPSLENDDQIFLAEALEDSEIKKKILKELPRQMYLKSFIDKLKVDIKQGRTLDDDQKTVIFEWLAYENIGISCFSDILVLIDNSASIMFAHYGQNLTGLALIYEKNEMQNISRKVNYLQPNRRPGSGGSAKRLNDWHEGTYKEVSDFLYKSDKWAYEAEHRFFSKPGVWSAMDYGMDLKAILYTPRLGGSMTKKTRIQNTLNQINDECYEGKLRIAEINASASKYLFYVEDQSNMLLSDWVLDNFIKCYPTEDYQFVTNLNLETLFQCHLDSLYNYQTEELKDDINFVRELISNGMLEKREFFAMINTGKDCCSFSIKKIYKINVSEKGNIVLVVDDFYLRDVRQWKIAKKLFEKLKEYANKAPIHVQIAGEDEMTRRFLKSVDGIKIVEIYKFL